MLTAVGDEARDNKKDGGVQRERGTGADGDEHARRGEEQAGIGSCD